MAVHKILSLLLSLYVPALCRQAHVPILRYIDTQNEDGSYTYGFEGGDGTYKIERRFSDGQVSGKYGYYDPDGVLREATYGASSSGGFEPKIDGVVFPLPRQVDPADNEIIQPILINKKRISNFSPAVRKPKGGVRNINGRRAVLRRRIRVKSQEQQQLNKEVLPINDFNLNARQEQLKQLEQQRQQLLELQQRAGGRRNIKQIHREDAQAKKANLQARQTQLDQLEQQRQQLLVLQQRAGSGRNIPQLSDQFRSAATNSFIRNPFITRLDMNTGSYTITY